MAATTYRSHNQDEQTIHILSKAFRRNKRMRSLIVKGKSRTGHSLHAILRYCYFMVKKWNGLYISADRQAYLLYYQKSRFYFSLRDLIHYGYLAFSVIGLKNLIPIFQREKEVKRRRAWQQEFRGDTDYLYIWILAQNQSQRRNIGSLLEAKNHILQRSYELQIPLYMETTDPRLVPIYERAGFVFYDRLDFPEARFTIWFGRQSPPLVAPDTADKNASPKTTAYAHHSI